MSTDWYTLGQNVKISDSKLDGFKEKHGDNEARMNAVFKEWIKIDSKKVCYFNHDDSRITFH